MSNKKTCRYQSNLGATRKIDARNYLTEYILIRHATNKNIKLPDRIWQFKFSKLLQWKYWYGLYHGELKRATKLLAQFELNDILTALNTNEGKIILSLVNKKLTRLIKETQHNREFKEKTKENITLTLRDTNLKPRSSYGKKSKLGKLR